MIGYIKAEQYYCVCKGGYYYRSISYVETIQSSECRITKGSCEIAYYHGS